MLRNLSAAFPAPGLGVTLSAMTDPLLRSRELYAGSLGPPKGQRQVSSSAVRSERRKPVSALEMAGEVARKGGRVRRVPERRGRALETPGAMAPRVARISLWTPQTRAISQAHPQWVSL